MTRAAIRVGAGERFLAATAPIGRVSRTMALVAGASLLGHLAVVGMVAVAARSEAPPPTEIAVEIVREVPKPMPAKPRPEPAKAEATKPASAKSEPPKPEPTKSEPTKSAPTKSAPTKSAPTKSAPPKSEPAKAVASKPEPARQEPAKAEVSRVAKAKSQERPTPPKAERKIAVAPPAPRPARDEAAKERKLASLQQELDGLRAEQAQLQAARDAEAASSAVQPKPVALRDTGLGLLPVGFQAVALPSTTDGAGEAASYEAIVFSALAKAKGIGRRQGIPGTAGVRFSVDAVGKLVAVELITWSGIPELDTEALALVRRAVFPPPPQGAQRTFVANVNFEVDHSR